jgi:phosphinothricin acetyltransferase
VTAPTVQPMTAEHAPAVLAIYRAGLETGDASFDTTSSVYVAPSARGRGVGRTLLEALISSSEAAGIWTIQAGVFPENVTSLRLHEAAQFRVVGVHRKIGRHHGRWRDVVLLERRSPTVT